MDRGDPGSHGQRRSLVEQREHLTDLPRWRRPHGPAPVGPSPPCPGWPPVGRSRAPRGVPPAPVGVATRHLREGQRPPFLRVLGALRCLGQEFGGSDVAGEGDRAVEHHRVVAGLLQRHPPRGTSHLPCVGERHLGPFEGVQEPGMITGPAARPGEPLEVVGPKRLIGVGVAQRGPRRGPLALVVCGSGVVEERFAAWTRRKFVIAAHCGRPCRRASNVAHESVRRARLGERMSHPLVE